MYRGEDKSSSSLSAYLERRVLLAATRIMMNGKKGDESGARGTPELKRLLSAPPRELLVVVLFAIAFAPKAVLR